jgi:hypothetical protein
MSQKFVPPLKPRQPVATVFREAIAKAEAEGIARPAMTLRLTLADEAHLRRDRTVALDDIRFSDGVMHFLDVKVVAGGVATSDLEISGG